MASDISVVAMPVSMGFTHILVASVKTHDVKTLGTITYNKLAYFNERNQMQGTT